MVILSCRLLRVTVTDVLIALGAEDKAEKDRLVPFSQNKKLGTARKAAGGSSSTTAASPPHLVCPLASLHSCPGSSFLFLAAKK